jgi:hypothetical protein
LEEITETPGLDLEVLSDRYESFDELADEFMEHENRLGRRVPDYELGIMLVAIGTFLLERIADKLISEVLDWKRRSAQGKLEEERHLELLDKLDELRQTMQQAVEARPQQSTLGEGTASVSVLLEWLKQNNVSIAITLETEAEGDLEEALEALTASVPHSSVSDAVQQFEGNDSA